MKVASQGEAKSQLVNEAQFLLGLQHEGIVRARGIYQVKMEGDPALGMLLDYKRGGDLKAWIPAGGLPEAVARGLAAPVGEALAFLHRRPA